MTATDLLDGAADRGRALLPGFAVSGVVAMTAQFLADHYGAPAMLMAILLGVALQFLGQEGRTVEGIAFTARYLLRFGVALLGVRVSVEMVQALGPWLVGLVACGVAVTIGFGLLAGRLAGQPRSFSFLTAGAVAICGASAAMAIASILPRRPRAEQDLAFAVVGITVLSTTAMILYPLLASALGLGPRLTGVFLGGTIHDVAQVVGAGFSVSDATGELSTLVKLIRVTMLAPVVLIASMILRASAAEGGARPPLIPGFVLGFLVLAAINSAGVIPAPVAEAAAAVSRWALLTAIAAVGMKTSIPEILKVGGPAIALIVADTVFLAVFILVGAALLG